MLEKKVRFLLTEHHAQHFPDGKGKNGEDLVSKDLTEEGVLHPQIWQDPTGTAPSIRNSTDQVSLKENCEFLARMSPIESIKMEGDKTRILAVYQSAAERYFKVSIYYLLVLGFFFLPSIQYPAQWDPECYSVFLGITVLQTAYASSEKGTEWLQTTIIKVYSHLHEKKEVLQFVRWRTFVLHSLFLVAINVSWQCCYNGKSWLNPVLGAHKLRQKLWRLKHA